MNICLYIYNKQIDKLFEMRQNIKFIKSRLSFGDFFLAKKEPISVS